MSPMRVTRRRRFAALSSVALVAALPLAGCGGGEEAAEPGSVVEKKMLGEEPMTFSLADGRTIKVAVTMGMSEVSDHAEEPTPAEFAPGRDAVIAVLGAHTAEELATPKDREKVKEHLVEALEEHYHGVEEVYFSDFIIP